jgi:hypothetical protein
MSSSEAKTPVELRAERFDSLRDQWNAMRSRASLAQLHDEIEDTASEIDALPLRIVELRNRGYIYSRSWEEQSATLKKGWPRRRHEAQIILKNQARETKDLATEIDDLCNRSVLSDRGLNRLEGKLEGIESFVGSAESAVRGAFDSVKEQIWELQREFRSVQFLLDTLDTTSFDLYPDETGVAACEAEWINHPDEPEGMLILTAGRLIFEQRERKAKKKILFVTTKSELVQEKLWESVVGNIASLEAEDKKRFLKRKELLHISFRQYTHGLHGEVTLRLKGATNEEWAGLIKRVQTGEIEADRFDAPSAEAPQAAPPQDPAEVPTKCPACGGKLPSLVKGMRELVCEYCNTSIRV